ncbi:MAG: hypothetical protein J0H31_09930 [Alphaproteobacteria bacterium]|nr:hypothetical protein [Alphaproteobacteria bacterium]
MPRYATLITSDDGQEIVSGIGEFETSSRPRAGRVEEVAPGVRIGMVRGGPVDAVGGFGFPRRDLSPSAVREATAKLKATAAPAPCEEPAKPARARPRKKPARKARKAKAAKAPSNVVAHD